MADSNADDREGRNSIPPDGQISATELSRRMEAGSLRLLDVRTPAEFAYVHAVGATNLPLELVNPKDMLAAGSQEPIYVICRAGTRSSEAVQKLRSAGLAAFVVQGGTLAWLDARLPVVWGKRRRKLPSTRAIVFGSIMVLSAILAITVHRGLLGIAGLAAAWVVAIKTLDPRKWPWRTDEEEVTQASPG